MTSVTDEPDYERDYHEDAPITIRKGDLRAILDICTGSMDFGSGFLVEEQVEALRKAAVMLGIDPRKVTPDQFVRRYVCDARGHHSWVDAHDGTENTTPARRCEDCDDYESQCLVPDCDRWVGYRGVCSKREHVVARYRG